MAAQALAHEPIPTWGQCTGAQVFVWVLTDADVFGHILSVYYFVQCRMRALLNSSIRRLRVNKSFILVSPKALRTVLLIQMH